MANLPLISPLRGQLPPCGDDAALRGTMSLENQVSDGLPPFYIWHTVEDASVPVKNSMLLATALTAHKVPFELHLFAHDGHGRC